MYNEYLTKNENNILIRKNLRTNFHKKIQIKGELQFKIKI